MIWPFEMDDKLDLRRLPDRQIGGLRTFSTIAGLIALKFLSRDAASDLQRAPAGFFCLAYTGLHRAVSRLELSRFPPSLCLIKASHRDVLGVPCLIIHHCSFFRRDSHSDLAHTRRVLKISIVAVNGGAAVS